MKQVGPYAEGGKTIQNAPRTPKNHAPFTAISDEAEILSVIGSDDLELVAGSAPSQLPLHLLKIPEMAKQIVDKVTD